ncbi:unnamed protein product [Bursaphelenchus xylophilus]|uniref:(pine wood nematode) hypothetical protein n=1 Tax=Bursaphelenchus xylophilus TaxID=6326 RepID=A0A7I8XPR1_BURXY|nr:unnamed protein product [Bursaphelenchus xylophilus]CAG9087167.1 unnamed protein product [Bursaphelenchus xylophilus]
MSSSSSPSSPIRSGDESAIQAMAPTSSTAAVPVVGVGERPTVVIQLHLQSPSWTSSSRQPFQDDSKLDGFPLTKGPFPIPLAS